MQTNARLSYARMEEHVTLKIRNLSVSVPISIQETDVKQVRINVKFVLIYFLSKTINVYSRCYF